MKRYNIIIAVVSAVIIFTAIISDIVLLKSQDSENRLAKVEINRVVQELSQGNKINSRKYKTILGVYEYNGEQNFFDAKNEYVIKQFGNKLYRIEYNDIIQNNNAKPVVIINIFFALLLILLLLLLFYIKRNIIKPFSELNELPLQLAKGKLSIPLKENKNRYFGKFIWSLDMLREELEQSKVHELETAKNEKTLLLSLSHDIKTPLSAIKLYSKAISKGLYSDSQKQIETAESINLKADEIEGYVNEIAKNLSEDFMTFNVTESEFYLSQVIEKISSYYEDKLPAIGTDFKINDYIDCILSGDADRIEEVLQNIIENAVKYGDGHYISLSFSDEEECRLIKVSNSGCTLSEAELPHIFDSFWRGSNTNGQQGSGLGLYICRRLMNAMGGEIFAEISDENMNVVIVCRKAV